MYYSDFENGGFFNRTPFWSNKEGQPSHQTRWAVSPLLNLFGSALRGQLKGQHPPSPPLDLRRAFISTKQKQIFLSFVMSVSFVLLGPFHLVSWVTEKGYLKNDGNQVYDHKENEKKCGEKFWEKNYIQIVRTAQKLCMVWILPCNTIDALISFYFHLYQLSKYTSRKSLLGGKGHSTAWPLKTKVDCRASRLSDRRCSKAGNSNAAW